MSHYPLVSGRGWVEGQGFGSSGGAAVDSSNGFLRSYPGMSWFSYDVLKKQAKGSSLTAFMQFSTPWDIYRLPWNMTKSEKCSFWSQIAVIK